MKNLFPTLQCVLRIALAATLGYTVSTEYFHAEPTLIGWYVSPQKVGLTTSLICALLATISIWLVFGVRTRVVAVAGLALYLGLNVVKPGFHNTDLETLRSSAFVIFLTLPLIIFGGGRFSLFRAGWRGLGLSSRSKQTA